MDRDTLRAEVKALLADGLRLNLAPGDIPDDSPIFGTAAGDGLGLDSIERARAGGSGRGAVRGVDPGRGRRQAGVRVGPRAGRFHRRGAGPVAWRRPRTSPSRARLDQRLGAMCRRSGGRRRGTLRDRPAQPVPPRGRCRIAAQVPEAVADAPGVAAGGPTPPVACRSLRARGGGAGVPRRRGSTASGVVAPRLVGATTGGMRETEEAYRRRRSGIDRRFRVGRMLGTPLSTSAAAVSQAFGSSVPGARSRPRARRARWRSPRVPTPSVAGVRGRRRRRQRPALPADVCGLRRAAGARYGAVPSVRSRSTRSLAGRGRGGAGAGGRGHARARGARVRALLLGHGITADAHHVTAPHPDGAGARAALTSALASAGVRPDAVDYVNAHGSGTRQNDAVEIGTLRTVFGARLPRVPVSSSKSQVGHTLGGGRRHRGRHHRARARARACCRRPCTCAAPIPRGRTSTWFRRPAAARRCASRSRRRTVSADTT